MGHMVKNQPAQRPESNAERDAAAAMVEAVAPVLLDEMFNLGWPELRPETTERVAAAVLRAGLRALATHQHRTPSALPDASPVAWLRTVASELARVEPGGGGVADTVQDGAGTVWGGAEAVGSAVGADGGVAGASRLIDAADPRTLAMAQLIAERLGFMLSDLVDDARVAASLSGKELWSLSKAVLDQADQGDPARSDTNRSR